MSEMSNVYILILDAFKSEKKKKKNHESWKICNFNLPGVLLLREGN